MDSTNNALWQRRYQGAENRTIAMHAGTQSMLRGCAGRWVCVVDRGQKITLAGTVNDEGCDRRGSTADSKPIVDTRREAFVADIAIRESASALL